MTDRTAETVMVAYPYGTIEPRFVKSLMFLLKWDHDHHDRVFGGGAFLQMGTTNVAHGRNLIARRFLDDTPADWLWFIDTDMEFDPDTLDRLVEQADPTERPIMGALCFSLLKGDAQEISPTLYGVTETDGRAVPTRHLNLPDPPGVYEVAATGAGCLLIHRTALEGVQDYTPDGGTRFGDTSWPWFRWTDWVNPDGEPDVMGEDLAFCLRAGAAGYPTYVDTRIEVGHVKPVVIDQGTYRGQFARGVPNFAVVPVKNRLDLTQSIVRQLHEQGGCDILVMDNGSNTKTRNWLDTQDMATVVDCDGWGIHEMWNKGVSMACERAAVCNVALLNNDLNLGTDHVARLAAGLRSDPKLLAVCGNYDGRTCDHPVEPLTGIAAGREDGSGGLAGYDFMVKGEMFAAGFPPFDEDYHWFFGDNHFVLEVAKHGGWYGMVADATVEHIGGGSQTASEGTGKRLGSDRLRQFYEQDEATFHEKWPELFDGSWQAQLAEANR